MLRTKISSGLEGPRKSWRKCRIWQKWRSWRNMVKAVDEMLLTDILTRQEGPQRVGESGDFGEIWSRLLTGLEGPR